ncbi:MAG: CoA-binding protein [Psychroflexus maritimus]
MKDKTNLVLGASSKTTRYSKMAIELFQNKGEDVIAIGSKEAEVGDVKILTTLPDYVKQVHTVTIYLKPPLQKQYEKMILDLHPKRVIFNPGTNNIELQNKLASAGVEVLSACTLVLIQTNQY